MTSAPQMLPEISIRDIMTVLFKQKWIILSVFIGISTLVAIGTVLMVPTYEAESTVMVKMGREHVYQSEIGSGKPAVTFDQARVIETEIQILTSRDLLKRVIEVIGVANFYPDSNKVQEGISPIEASIIRMREALSITNVTNSNVIRIALQHQDPEMAAHAVNLLVDFLLERHLQIFSTPRADFLAKQVTTRHERLDLSRAKLQDFKQRHGLSSLLDEERLLLEQRRDLDTSLKIVQNDREGLKSKIASLMQQIHEIPKFISLTSVSERQKVIDEAKSNLLKLRLQEQEISTRYKKTSRRVQNIRNEITMTQAFLREQEAQLMDKVTKGKNPVYQELEVEIHKSNSEYRSLKTQAEEITRQIEEVDAKLGELDSLEKEHETLQRTVESDQNNYSIYLEKVEEARVAQEMNQLKMANISIIQVAAVPVKPIKPQKILYVLLGIAFGALTSITLAFAAEYFQSGYTRPEQASQDLGLPILVSIKHQESST